MPAKHSFILIFPESNYPPMGALYLGHALSQSGITTHLVGSSASTAELDHLIETVDPVAIGCSVMTAPEIVDFVRHSIHVQRTYNDTKKRLPVIWGGMHSTIVGRQTTEEEYIDVVVSGEAEHTLPQILTTLIRRAELPASKFISVRTPLELDELRPAWEMIDAGRYLFPESHSVHADVEFKHQSIFYYLLTSRGCTYRCNFCWEVARTAALKVESRARDSKADLVWRGHSAAWVENQLVYLEGRLAANGHTIDGVGLWDDMIFGRGTPEHTERAKAIFRRMKERNFGYLLEARANQLIARSTLWNDAGISREADLYKCLRETGCMQVFVGTESGNQETLNLIQKGTKLKDYLRLVEISRDAGLPLRFSMIVGFPNESERSVNDTLDLIERLESEPCVSVSGPKLFTPYPGTPQFDAAVVRGLRIPQDTLGWARLTRYADYRSLYPWLAEDYSESTLKRIDAFWEQVPEAKKARPREDVILDIIRGH
jgi:radical SAM superfamily enzyme YgiQ (UPF0313 family)